MPRGFNTAGPNNAAYHYTLPATGRLPSVRQLIERHLYWVVYAPRQVGKTTALRALAHNLTAEGNHAAVLVSMGRGSGLFDDLGAAELTIVSAWRSAAEEDLPAELQPPPFPDAPPGSRICAALAAWTKKVSPKPLVIFLDEIDALEGHVLLSVLRQLRDGYQSR